VSVDNVANVEVVGASKLTDIYGYWISFHDASVETVLVERVGPTVTIGFKTCDMAYHAGELMDSDRKARVVVRWHQVKELSLIGIDPEERNWIDGLVLTARGEDVRTELELLDGMQRVIIARRVEIVEVEPL
jgi:hypothetical protein